MNKISVYELIVSALKKRFETAQWAARQAYDAATSEESVAENKYDTFGLEASYLAHGQSQRVLECENDYLHFSNHKALLFTPQDEIKLGALVGLQTQDCSVSGLKWFYLSACAGGLSIDIEGEGSVFLVTPSSPVGLTLMGKMEGDDVGLKQSGKETVYEIVSVL
ncbi:transcription elongation factor [Marinomonas pollencensis]|uniref:GreA/GreB family elongation factor n=1 Tax=Marinomonas pollencensis TaxID=491954 RepID=A0A3E0DR88_9GAMM|nr:transcription elongation factor [Marinomonas pollencensis]REG85524.1 GreA/GreB family elongation factor [Marinomonas pollencensis]